MSRRMHTIRIMFAFLRGTIARKAADYVEIDVGGVGYKVWVPAPVQGRLRMGGEATLLVHCHIREDAFQIFGFLREEERALFELLLTVSGIGPKVALAVLSGMSVQEFGRAVLDSDVRAFERIGGIGKKTAQRIVLEVKAKLGQDTELDAILGERPAAVEDLRDVIEALCALGCTIGEARRAAAQARKQLSDDAPPEELVRAALRSMSKV